MGSVLAPKRLSPQRRIGAQQIGAHSHAAHRTTLGTRAAARRRRDARRRGVTKGRAHAVRARCATPSTRPARPFVKIRPTRRRSSSARLEGDVRVAVVRAGFCGRCRGVAAAALASALHRANVKALRVEDRWQLDDENDEEAAVVVARAEATGAAG